jgi:hypothetical protein
MAFSLVVATLHLLVLLPFLLLTTTAAAMKGDKTTLKLTRRLRKRAAARASVQAAGDSAAEAAVRAEQEAAAGVATGVEEAQADGRRKGEKDESAKAQTAGESKDDDTGEEEVAKVAFSFPSPKRERKLSDEEQVETKRPKSPGRQDEQQEEQHVHQENTVMMKENIALTHRLMEMVNKGFYTQFGGAHQVSLPLGGVPDRAPK